VRGVRFERIETGPEGIGTLSPSISGAVAPLTFVDAIRVQFYIAIPIVTRCTNIFSQARVSTVKGHVGEVECLSNSWTNDTSST
jgi:hypothetical protein